MTLLAECLCVASLAVRIQCPDAGHIAVIACKVGALMIKRQQRNELGMATLAGVRCFAVVMAGVAGSHRREVRRPRFVRLVKTLMAGSARHVFHTGMELMRKFEVTFRRWDGLYVARIGMAEAATRLLTDLVFVATHARIVTAAELV